MKHEKVYEAYPGLLKACQAVLEWARTPGNHGGNPYCHKFMELVQKAVDKAEGRTGR